MEFVFSGTASLVFARCTNFSPTRHGRRYNMSHERFADYQLYDHRHGATLRAVMSERVLKLAEQIATCMNTLMRFCWEMRKI